MRLAFAFLLSLALLFMPAGGVTAEVVLSAWEASVDFVPPDKEHIHLFLDVQNKGTEGISGVQLALAADELKYVEEDKLTFEGEETSKKLSVSTSQEPGKSVITVMFPRILYQGQSEQVFLNFNSKGLLRREGNGYVATVLLYDPNVIMENGETHTMSVNTGSIRFHVPEGYVYTKYSPTPWREIWQGVSGFKAHYILVFNGGIPISNPITVSFQESKLIKRAVKLYETILDLESSQSLPKEDIDTANGHITEAATYVVRGDAISAAIELDKAERILTGQSSGVAAPLEIEEISVEKGISRKLIYGLVFAFLALVLVSLILGKKIISSRSGGKGDV
jgi:hypothetical protein